MYNEIISEANFRLAYLKIVDQFAADRKNYAYHGLDNLLLNDFDLNSQELIALARTELILKKAITPALSLKIPKKSNPEKFREIFVYNIKERIKAQAISQVLLPEFEKHFSDRLFSYRPGKPPYIAAKLFARRYRRSHNSDFALIMDLENYSDLIDKDILFSKLQTIFSESEVLDCLKLFIYNRVYREGLIDSPSVGLVQGVPLIALFANLYLTELDFKYQAKVPFYIRIGDDIALLDKNYEKLKLLEEEFKNDLVAHKLRVNEKKLYLGPATGNFSFLGYNFAAGLISLPDSYIKRYEMDWKKILVYKNSADKRKDYIFKKIMEGEKSNYNRQFLKIISDKPQINDGEQLRKLSENFFHIMTKFFFVDYTPRNRRLLETKLREYKIVSLYKTYTKFHYERD